MEIDESKLSPQLQKGLEQVKARWFGKRLLIKGRDHPHFMKCGEAIAIEETNVGVGIKIRLEDAFNTECFVFHRKDIEII